MGRELAALGLGVWNNGAEDMIVVTGAGGFIGSALVWQLNQAGLRDIVCVDEMGSGQKFKNLAKRQFVQLIHKDQFLDYLDQQGQEDHLEAIFHMGACSSTTEKDVDFLLETNLHYSQHLFEWCTENHVPLIYASSCSVYGSGTKGFDDSSKLDEFVPLNGYGFSKLLFDRWVLSQAEQPPQCVGLRFSNVFGPQEYHKGDQASVAYKAFHQIQTKGKLDLFRSHRADYKDGEQVRDFVYVKDVTRWMLEILYKKIPSGVYNMGFGQSRNWIDLGQACFKALDRKPAIEFIEMPTEIQPHYQYFTEAKMNRLRSLGLSKPEFDLEAGVRDFFQNYLLREDRYL